MKKLALAMVLSGLAFSPALYANEPAPAVAPAVKEEAKAPSHKEEKHAAKKECIKENPNLKGKELHECVKSKMVK